MSPPSTDRPRRLTPALPPRHGTLWGEPPRRDSEPLRWWRWLPVILLLGLLAMLRVTSQARLSELDWESRRLDRLTSAEGMRRAELLRARTALIAHSRLSAVAGQEGMVAPSPAKPIQVGALPEPRIYWELPEETGPAHILSGQQVGQLPPPPAGPPSARP